MKWSISLVISWIAAISALQAQAEMQQVLTQLNAPFEEQLQYRLDTLFKGQDTIFTETDSFILYTTPEMMIAEWDTAAYQLREDNTYEWDYNEDGLKDWVSVAYLADKRNGQPLAADQKQYLLIATAMEDSIAISYFEAVVISPNGGMNGGTPDISILTKGNTIELMEAGGIGANTIINHEYHLEYQDEQLLLQRHIYGEYHDSTENLIAYDTDWDILVQSREYEGSDGQKLKQKATIAAAPLSRAIEVDGQLEEEAWNRSDPYSWRPLHANMSTEKHRMNDLYAKFSVAWRAGQLLIGMKVKDDQLVPFTYDSTPLGDYIQIDIDPKPIWMQNGVFVENPTESHRSLVIGFDAKGNPSIVQLDNGEIITEAVAAFHRTKDGYHTEIILPMKGLISGQEIAFTASVVDSDDRKNPIAKNRDASSHLVQRIPFYMGMIRLYDTIKPLSFRTKMKHNSQAETHF